MTESNPTQVILTDDGIKIIKAQVTADSAASGVDNLNDPDLMSVIEKQNSIAQFAGLTSQYNVIMQNAKDDGIDTTAVTTAYNNLNKFMAGILADPNHASDIDRVRYKKYQDAYNEELSKLQNALQNSANNKFTSAASATSQAATTASQAFSEAQSAFDKANSTASAFGPVKQSADSAVASALNAQTNASSAVTKAESTASEFGKVSQKTDSAVANALSAQSSASDAVKQASSAAADSKDAKQIAGAVRQSYKTLTDGSTMTIAELESGLAVKLTKKDLDGYATETWAQNQIKTTADGINDTMSSIKSTVDSHTTNINDLKADSKGFKEQFTTVTDAVDKHSKDIGTLQASSKELSSNFDSLSSDNKTNQHNIGQLQQTAKSFSSTLTTVQTQVDNSAVGTNLLLNTPDYSNNWDWTVTPSIDTTQKPAILHYPRTTITSGTSDIAQQAIGTILQPSTTYTASFYAKGSGNFIFYCYPGVAATISSVNGVVPSSTSSDCHTTIPLTSIYVRYTITFTTLSSISNSKNFLLRQDYNSSDASFNTVEAYVYGMKLEKGSIATDWSPAPEDLATQSQFTQLSNDIGFRVKKDDLIDQINIQAGNTLISSSGQLTLSGKNIYFDTANPVIIPSANIDKLLTRKKITAADISANTFSTNNGTFVVDKSGAITAKNMTLIDGKLSSPTINGSTINGGTLNMKADGLINSPYTGIEQSADQYYHPWKLNTGQLTIGQGYITSVSSGTRSINGVPKQFNHLQGTLSASYLKFTNDYGSRTYVDADMFTYSNQTNDTAIVTIDASGIGINMGTEHAPALTIKKGYIDASSSSSYGVFGAITLGYTPHTINSDNTGIYFESGIGSGNPGINIWAKGFHSMSSRLSTKRQVRLLDDEHSNSLLLGADTATFQYNQDTNADNSNEGVIIDDVNTAKQYGLPDELITRDGKAPTDLMSFIARVISQNKYQARLIEDLQIRLRKVEIKNE